MRNKSYVFGLLSFIYKIFYCSMITHSKQINSKFTVLDNRNPEFFTLLLKKLKSKKSVFKYREKIDTKVFLSQQPHLAGSPPLQFGA